MQDKVIGKTSAYFIIHQYKDEDGKYDAEVLERLTPATEDEYNDAFDSLEYELREHSYEDRFSVVKVEAELIRSYCHDYACYEYDEELHIEEVEFSLKVTT